MSKLRKIDELDDKFKITLDNGKNFVAAPLHDEFGFTVGSEYTTPFDLGTLSGALQKASIASGVISPVGLRMRRMYSNPEPTELSFKMTFDAYYDAHIEVAIPVITLVTMGLGRELTKEDIDGKLSVLERSVESTIGVDFGGDEDDPYRDGMEYDDTPKPTISSDDGGNKPGISSKVMGLIKMINSPPVCTLKFGEFITMDNVFITSTAVTFSNNLDSRGIPMSADVNVTCTLQTAPIAEDIIKYFGGIGSERSSGVGRQGSGAPQPMSDAERQRRIDENSRRTGDLLDNTIR